jgi:hypothetical protein
VWSFQGVSYSEKKGAASDRQAHIAEVLDFDVTAMAAITLLHISSFGGFPLAFWSHLWWIE